MKNKLVRPLTVLIVGFALHSIAPKAVADGNIFDGYIQINSTWYNTGGVNDGRNDPNGSANQSTRTSFTSADFGTQTFGNFNITGFQIYGWTSSGTSVENSGANYKVWRSGDSEPSYVNFWDTFDKSYYSGGDYTVSGFQSTGLIGDTFINGATYNLKIQTYTVLSGDNAGSKFYEPTTTFVVDGARQLITGASNTNQASAYNTSADGGVVKQGTGSLTLTKDNSNVTTGQKGLIFIDEGTVAVNPDGGVSGDNALGGASAEVRLGAEGGSAAAKFALTDGDGGLSISRNLVVRSGSSGTKTIAAENASGTNTLSGGVFLDDNVTITAASGGTFDFSGRFEDGLGAGSYAITIGGNGKVLFSGSTNNTGITGYTVNDGATLVMDKSSADAVQSTLTINSGGTAEFAASNQLGSSAAVVNNGTLATGSGSITDTFGSLTNSGTISGNGTLTAGTYTLSGGTVNANLGAGTLNITGNAALNGTSGAGTVAITGGNLTLGTGANRLSSSADVTISLDRSLNIASDQTLASVRETAVDNGGTVSIGSGATLTINGADKGTLLQNTISGDGSLTLAANNTVLSLYETGGANTIGGTFTISAGTLGGSVTLTASTYALNGGAVNAKLGAGAVTVADGTTTLGSAGRLDSASTLTVNSGQLTLGGNETVSSLGGSGGTLALGANNLSVGSGNFGGLLSGEGGILTKTGSGSLTLSGDNTYTGGTLLNGGELIAGHVSAFGTGGITVGSGTTLNFSNFNVANIVTNNGGTILSAGVLSNLDAEAGETTIAGAGSTVSSVAGTATVNVNAENVTVDNVTGGTVNASAGGLQVASLSSSATVNIGGADARIAAMSGGTVNAGASGLVVTNFNGGNIAVSNGVTVGLRSGSSSGVISGSGGIAKQGASTLTLAGDNTYTGATTVEAGKLVVNGSIASDTTVQSGATLGGSGTIASATIEAGGTIDPGNSPGTLTLTNGLTWNGGGNYNWQIYDADGTAGTDWDLIAVTGGTWDISGLSSTNQFNINLWSLSGISPDVNGEALNFDNTIAGSWTILTYSTLSGTFDTSLFALNTSPVNGTAGFANSLGSGLFTLALDTNSQSMNLLFDPTGGGGGPGEPIPEPGTWVAAALLAGAAGYMRWRRRRVGV